MSFTKVAKLAGVSCSTVSRVINNHPRVALHTEQAVRRAMEQLGFSPSTNRPGPKPQPRFRVENANLAFFVLGASGSHSTPAFSDLLRGVSLAATEAQMQLSFHFVPDVRHLPSRVLEQPIDGILLHGAPPGPEIRRRLRTVPTVWLMGNRRRPEWGDQVMPDTYEIGRLAAMYLVRRGHRRLVFLNMDHGHWPFRQCCLAFSAAAAEQQAHVICLEQDRPSTGDYWHAHSAAAAESIVERYVALTPRPTGIFVADDTQVALLQSALQTAGVKLGRGHAQIISCNNERPFLVGLTPRPAEVDIRAESIGRRGVEQLAWRMSHPQRRERVISSVEPCLIESNDDHDQSMLDRPMSHAG